MPSPTPVPAQNPPITTVYRTKAGRMLHGRIEDALTHDAVERVQGRVNLIFTSPPFPLVTKKRYGNRDGTAYLSWLRAMAQPLAQLLAPDGSIVLEIGNAWEPGSPTMSTLPLRALLEFQEASGLHLCQQVICHNPARLPSPAQWVTVERIRLKDSYTHLWWMSPTPRPKADNAQVLLPYGDAMKRLLKRKTYNSGRRPSGHTISEAGFFNNNGGSIAANVLDLETGARVPHDLVKFAGTSSDAKYRQYCMDRGLESHPARMQSALVAFFVNFLTTPGDLVFDPFAGSNTTGAVSESLGRSWLSVEANADYAQGSRARFLDDGAVPVDRRGAGVAKRQTTGG